MNLFEAKKILKSNGYNIIKESDFDLETYLYDQAIKVFNQYISILPEKLEERDIMVTINDETDGRIEWEDTLIAVTFRNCEYNTYLDVDEIRDIIAELSSELDPKIRMEVLDCDELKSEFVLKITAEIDA